MPSFVPPLGMLARCAIVLLVLAAVGGFLTAWSGLYSVAASRGHWPGFELFLKFGMRSSVRTHALLIEVPPLDDTRMIRRGAAHFQQGCAPCHGSPAGASMQVVRSMLPEPSDLEALVPTWKTKELFWIVKNGLKYTGMPAWPAQSRDDEVWDVVAFLRELPGMPPDRYRRLAGFAPGSSPAAERQADRTSGGEPARAALLETCARCHGADGRGRDTTAFPRLDLQGEDWLLAQLQSYAAGHRPSGVMQAATAELSPQETAWLARHYATVAPRDAGRSGGRSAAFPPEGEALFLRGAPDQGLPACIACHAAKAEARDRAYPALLGQHAGYTETQLTLYRDGKRRATEPAQLMSTIASRMSGEQIRAVAAYLAAQPGSAAAAGR